VPLFAAARDVEGSRSQEAQEWASITGKVSRVPTMVFHNDLISTLAVLVNALKEFTSVSRTHSLVCSIVRRQWPKFVVLEVLAKLLPSLLLYFLELDWLSPNESLEHS